jgi:hypothetical protein
VPVSPVDLLSVGDVLQSVRNSGVRVIRSREIHVDFVVMPTRDVESVVCGGHGLEVTLEPHTMVFETVAFVFPRGVKDSSCFISVGSSFDV